MTRIKMVILITRNMLLRNHYNICYQQKNHVLLSKNISFLIRPKKKRCCIALCDRPKNLEIYGQLFLNFLFCFTFFFRKKILKHSKLRNISLKREKKKSKKKKKKSNPCFGIQRAIQHVFLLGLTAGHFTGIHFKGAY